MATLDAASGRRRARAAGLSSLSGRAALEGWERLAEDYDALHLTDDGQWATRLSEPNLYGWDCESTLWFRWCFERVLDLGDVDWASRSTMVEAAGG